jgi:predicted permease
MTMTGSRTAQTAPKVQRAVAAERERDVDTSIHSEAPPHRGDSLCVGVSSGVTDGRSDANLVRRIPVEVEAMSDAIRFSIRVLAKSPAFCLVVIATLALGLGANTAVFGVLHAAMLTPLPYPSAERLVRIYLEREHERIYFPGAALVDLRDQSRTLDVASVYTYSERSVDLSDRGAPERVPVTLVSANYFDVMGVSPLAGRVFARGEERSDPRVAIVSQRIWQEYLGGDAGAVGRTLTMDGQAMQVIGVLPAWFEDPLQPRVEIWLPENLQPGGTNSWGNHRLSAIARLRPESTIDDARAEAEVITARQAPQMQSARRTAMLLIPLQQDIVGAAGPMLYVLLGAVGLLLLLACVNVASLMLARAAGRVPEMTVRAALGAARWRMVHQLLVESVGLSLAGGVAGLLLALAISKVLLAAAPVTVLQPDATLSVQVFLFGFAAAFLAGVGSGILPALHASRPDLDAVLREGGRGGGSSRRQARVWNALVVCQVGVALVLLVGAGLLLKSVQRLQQVDLGIQPDRVMTFQVNTPLARYPTEQRRQFHPALQRRIAALPGVTAVGAVSRLPVTGTYHSWGARIPGTSGWPLQPEQRVIEGDYFRAVGIPVVRGRTFGPEDHATAERRVVVSETVARTLFPHADPLGRQVQVLGASVTIIGVVPDLAVTARGGRNPAIYHSHTQFADNRNWALTQVVATGGPVPGLLDSVRRELQAMDAQLVLHQPQPLSDVIGRGRARERFSLQLLGAFALLALLIAAIGLYGVLAYAVTSRRREIGIRMALGAQPSSVRSVFVGTGGRLTALGLAGGVAVALVFTRALQSLLFDVSASDPAVFAGAALTLAAVALAASWIPARAATRVDPLEVLSR